MFLLFLPDAKVLTAAKYMIIPNEIFLKIRASISEPKLDSPGLNSKLDVED